MTAIKRTCSNCKAFNPTPTGDDPACWNLVSFTDHHGTPQAVTREPGPRDLCDDHLTQSEDDNQTALIEEHREQGGVSQILAAACSISQARAAIFQAMRSGGKQ